jgi:REP element-mobilizing transposase RayT
MPRKARIDAPGALHHIIVRGINRRKIFFDDADRDGFLDRLGDILSDSKTPCFAWALMTNQFHLLLRTGTAAISTVMRRLYLEFVKKGVAAGRRPELTGGGLVRSAGGWSALKAMRKGESRMKGDERILGRGDFVETVLKTARENLDRKSKIRSLGYDFDWLVGRVPGLFDLTFNELLTGGKQRKLVQARSVPCYWGHGSSG